MAGSKSMPIVEFAAALRRHVPCPPQQVPAGTVASALAAAFEAAPALRDYVLDEQGAVRKHVAVFVNGEMVRRDVVLARDVSAADRIMVIQALTGG
jgi:sulfur carrier protein ThiS